MLRVEGKMFYRISLSRFVCSSADDLTNTWALCSHPHLKPLQLMEASQSSSPAKPALVSVLPHLPLSSDFNGKSFFLLFIRSNSSVLDVTILLLIFVFLNSAHYFPAKMSEQQQQQQKKNFWQDMQHGVL